jgi:hypothetical protein
MFDHSDDHGRRWGRCRPVVFKSAFGVRVAGTAIVTICALVGTASAAAADVGQVPVTLGLTTTSGSSTFTINDHIGIFATFKAADVPSYGPEVELIRTDSADPAGVLVTTATFEDGSFQVADWPHVSGAITYSIAYPGDDTHAPAQASLAVTVTEQEPTTLTLNHNGGTYNYGTTVPFTAHLGHWDTLRDVAVMDRPAWTCPTCRRTTTWWWTTAPPTTCALGWSTGIWPEAPRWARCRSTPTPYASQPGTRHSYARSSSRVTGYA